MTAIRIAGRLVLLCLCSLAVVGLVTTCGDDGAGPEGGNGGGDLPPPSFADCWVSGLSYYAQTVSGRTETGGTFICPRGEMVTFKVGDITLGSGIAGWCLNPIEITGAADEFDYEATNVARFLQTIDDDGDPSNGIVIIGAVHTAAAGRSLNFNMHADAFTNDANTQTVIAALTAATTAGTRPLVDKETALNHLRRTMLAVLRGEYEGSFDGYRADAPVTGDWEIYVNPDGTITGVFAPDSGDPINMTGNMQPNGSFSCFDQGETGLNFGGKIVRNEHGLHDVEGSWHDYYDGAGSIDGSRTLYTMTIPCD